MCERQKIDESLFVDTWIAFSMTVLNSCIPPTADKLIVFEKKEFGDPVLSTPKQKSYVIVKEYPLLVLMHIAIENNTMKVFVMPKYY